MLGYLSNSVPLEKTDEEFAALINDIRAFAVNELGLATSKNYTTYVELDRDYLAAIVSASDKTSFNRYEWKFPIVGSVPYKGFFNIEDARKERAKLEKKDLDVWIRGVDAFSTLGWFKDPLYSYMRNYSPARLADLIIHESVHATVFIKNQITFNEELAEFIGSEGARLYIISRYGEDSDEYRSIYTLEEEYQKYVSFIHEVIAELETLYSSSLGREEILTQKDAIIKNAQKRFEEDYDKHFSTDRFRNFSTLPINNAFLELFRLYHDEDNFYKNLYIAAGSDLPAFIAAAKKITRKGEPREQLERYLLGL